ncbi:hypothetical protein JB92DRAFT_2829750 [Gautieria morchelliformis]|nr:hypothetical protein JB92DRAFT_2829750 [Gautieria morchelliformis]
MPLTAVNATFTAEVPPNLSELLGPPLIGIFLNWGLLGILGNQVYIYYLCFPRDSRYTKAFVYGLFLLEIAQTVMISRDGWEWLITSWGRPDQILNYHLTCIPCHCEATLPTLIKWFLTQVHGKISLMQGAAAIAAGIMVRRLPSLADIGDLFPVVSIWLGGSAATDIWIAVIMTYLLTREKNKTTFKRSNYILSRLMRLTIETGALTATVATVDVVVFNLFKHNNIHLCPAIVLGKLYTTTLMAVFNNRMFLHRDMPKLPSASASTGIEDHFATIRDAISRNSSMPQANRSFRETSEETDSKGSNIPLKQLSAKILCKGVGGAQFVAGCGGGSLRFTGGTGSNATGSQTIHYVSVDVSASDNFEGSNRGILYLVHSHIKLVTMFSMGGMRSKRLWSTTIK